MIYIQDNFIEKELFIKTTNSLNSNNYKDITAGEKVFHVQWPSNEFDSYVLDKLREVEQRNLYKIFSFFRVSSNKLDTDWRIHSDLIINGEKPDRAAIVYMSPKERNDLHGTALWSHKTYGKKLPKDTSNEEYDRMITKESENLETWQLNSVIGYEQNRLLSYPANYFHSKYPNKSWVEGRQVFVIFYKY